MMAGHSNLAELRPYMTSYATRRAVPADATAACEVVRRSITELCYQDHRGDRVSLKHWLENKTPVNFETWIVSKEHVAFAAEHETKLVGFAMLNLRGYVALLYVSPEARFKGISKTLLAALEEGASAAGIRELRLQSSATALRFYLDRGYALTGPPDEGFGLTSGYPMARQIEAGCGQAVRGA